MALMGGWLPHVQRTWFCDGKLPLPVRDICSSERTVHNADTDWTPASLSAACGPCVPCRAVERPVLP